MRRIEGILLPRDKHGEVNLRGNVGTCIGVSDHGSATVTTSECGDHLFEALSVHGEIPVVGGCFSSIRVKLGLPSKIRIAPVEEVPSFTFNEVATSIEKHLFTSDSAFLPACTVHGHEFDYYDVLGVMSSWSEASFNADFGPSRLTDRDDDGHFHDNPRIDVRDICPTAPQSLLLPALSEHASQTKPDHVLCSRNTRT